MQIKPIFISRIIIVFLIFHGIRCYSQSKPDTAVPIKGVTISGHQYEEEKLTGVYGQPEWTTQRRFSTTRIYLQKTPGSWGVEQWVKAQWNKGENPNFLFQEEFEIGLPGRVQLDLYENIYRHPNGLTQHRNFAVEIRWALAKWGRIPLNPTLYAEYKFGPKNEPQDFYEFKLLLGDKIGKGWHYGLNLFYEAMIGGAKEIEMGFSQGMSYSLLDRNLGLGVELKIETATEEGDRSRPPVEADLGPSIQWRVGNGFHLDFVPLFGLNDNSPQLEAWLVIGLDFGETGKTASVKPISTRSR